MSRSVTLTTIVTMFAVLFDDRIRWTAVTDHREGDNGHVRSRVRVTAQVNLDIVVTNVDSQLRLASAT
jgi:hypothetical protein